MMEEFVLERVWAVGEEAGMGGGFEAPAEGLGGEAGAAEGSSDAGEADAGTGAGEGTGEGEGGEGAGAGEGGEGTLIDDGEPLVGSKLWNAIKDQVAALDPKARSAVNKAIHQSAAIAKAFPEGVEQATKTIQSIAQLANTAGDAPEKAIAETLAERSYFRELDQAYTDATPAFVEKLLTAKPESFDKLAPMVFSKYAETNPDGFAGFVSRTVLQHLDNSSVPLDFKVLATFLPQLPEGPAKDRVIEAVEGIYAWQTSLRELGKKVPAAKAVETKPGAKPGDELAAREARVAEQEQAVTLKGWNTEAYDSGKNLVYAEADKAAGKDKLSAEERKKVLAKVGEELDIRLAGNKDYGQTMRGYLKAGKKTEFLQRLESERKKLIPGAARRAVDDIKAERRPAVKTAVRGAAVKTAANGGQQQQQGGAKTEWIAGHPSTQNLVVDLNRTSNAMLLKRTAYIKGRETPVSWK